MPTEKPKKRPKAQILKAISPHNTTSQNFDIAANGRFSLPLLMDAESPEDSLMTALSIVISDGKTTTQIEGIDVVSRKSWVKEWGKDVIACRVIEAVRKNDQAFFQRLASDVSSCHKVAEGEAKAGLKLHHAILEILLKTERVPNGERSFNRRTFEMSKAELFEKLIETGRVESRERFKDQVNKALRELGIKLTPR